ncbi:MAG: hypothetical protein ACRCXT_20665 [Paraclostridium sp.]
MKFKKTLISNLVLLGVLASPILSFADVPPSKEVYSTNNKMVDTRLIPHKSTIRESLPGVIQNLKANPVNTSNIDTKRGIASGTFALAKSSSSVKEDYIYAKVRVYDKYGAINGKPVESSEKKSSYTSAKAVPTCNINGAYAYGNHTYKLSGYKDVFHETKSFW